MRNSEGVKVTAKASRTAAGNIKLVLTEDTARRVAAILWRSTVSDPYYALHEALGDAEHGPKHLGYETTSRSLTINVEATQA